MDQAEVKQIAQFLLDCERAVHEQDGTENMRPYLHHLYQVMQRIRDAAPKKSDRDTRFALALAMRKALRLRRHIEERLGARN
jgi:hypothetical protein